MKYTRALYPLLYLLLYVFYDPFLCNSCGAYLPKVLLIQRFVLRELTMQAPYFSKLLVRTGSTNPASTPSTHRPIVPSSLRSPAASRPE
jgi:hypothetical protein